MGQLMIRAFVLLNGKQLGQITRLKEVKIERTEKGRPQLSIPLGLDFNVSHHGHWISLGGVVGPGLKLGVDVTTIENAFGLPWKGFVEPFLPHYAVCELKWLEQGNSEYEKMKRFFVLWVLKETILKALGIGITTELNQHYFQFTPKKENDKSLLKVNVFI